MTDNLVGKKEVNGAYTTSPGENTGWQRKWGDEVNEEGVRRERPGRFRSSGKHSQMIDPIDHHGKPDHQWKPATQFLRKLADNSSRVHACRLRRLFQVGEETHFWPVFWVDVGSLHDSSLENVQWLSGQSMKCSLICAKIGCQVCWVWRLTCGSSVLYADGNDVGIRLRESGSSVVRRPACTPSRYMR